METSQNKNSSNLLVDSPSPTESLENTLTFADTQIKVSTKNPFNYQGMKFPKIDMYFMSLLKEFDGVLLPKFSWHHFSGQTMEDIRDDNYKRFGFSKECCFDTYLTTSHPIQSLNPFVMHFQKNWQLSNNPNFETIKKNLKDEHRYSSLFTEDVPKDVQELCVGLKKQEPFSCIYLICEASNWKNQEISTIDPLVVMSLDSTCADDQQFYFMSKFDCTSSESYVSKEFTI